MLSEIHDLLIAFVMLGEVCDFVGFRLKHIKRSCKLRLADGL